MSGLDAIDRNIIRQLQLNARVSNTKLAAEVGLSPSGCLRRISLLEKQVTSVAIPLCSVKRMMLMQSQ